MGEGMNFERGSGEGKPEKRAFDPNVDLQIVPQTPEVTHLPADIAETDIGGFLKKQREKDNRRKDKEKPGLDA